MVEFIHKLTGTVMQVADDRVEEYKAAGHELAAPVKPEKPAAKKPAKKSAKTKK